ncbi:MAG: GNAT family N-acetyltransferase [Geobacteraceae bacterium]|nr:GNAT family N-acetyltransferase [Geobacteraceae bacterium]
MVPLSFAPQVNTKVRRRGDIYPDTGGGRIVGMISINDSQSPEYQAVKWQYPGRALVLVIHRLTIDPSHQRQGMATRLMDFAEKIAEKQGYETIRFAESRCNGTL